MYEYQYEYFASQAHLTRIPLPGIAQHCRVSSNSDILLVPSPPALRKRRVMLMFLSLTLAGLSTCGAKSSDARHIDWPTWASHVSLNHGNCSHELNSPLRFQLYLATMAAVEAQNQRSTRGESSWDAAIIPAAMLIPGDRNGFDACEPETEWMETQLRRLLGYATLVFPPLHRTFSIHFGMR